MIGEISIIPEHKCWWAMPLRSVRITHTVKASHCCRCLGVGSVLKWYSRDFANTSRADAPCDWGLIATWATFIQFSLKHFLHLSVPSRLSRLFALVSLQLSHWTRYAGKVITMSGGLDVLQMKEEDVLKFLAAGTHLGGTNLDFQMEQYVYKRKSDGKK